MLKKMRWRFIGAAMAAFTAVVLTLLCFVNLWNYHSVTNQQDEALTRLMEMEDQQLSFSPSHGTPPLWGLGSLFARGTIFTSILLRPL